MENADFNTILNSLAQNPETLRKLVSAVSDTPSAPAFSAQSASHELRTESDSLDKPALTGQNRDIENLIRLLSALKPYLDADKRGKIDGAIRILRIVSLASGAGLMGNERRG